MRYDKCVGYEGFECPVVKTGRNQKRPRCGSCAQKGNTHNRGRTQSLEHRAKIGAANSLAMKGKTLSLVTRQAMSLGKGGDGDILNRKYPGLARWVRLVKERDSWKCAECGYQGAKGKKDVDAHHVIPKSKSPELATVLFNGVTLCKPCHKEIHAT